MVDFDLTLDEEEAAYRSLCCLIYETLRDLKERVGFIHECWRGTSDEEKAQHVWCLALGVLAHDVGSGTLALIDADRLRAARILNRSLFEYHLRLRIYQANATEALCDAADAPKELRKFFESRPVSEMSKLNISAEDLVQFQKFIDDNQGKLRRRNVWNDLKTINAEDHAQAGFEYFNLYGFQSALSHGSGLVFKDVVQTRGETETVLAWKSPYISRFLVIDEVFVRLVGVLEAIEKTSRYFQAHVVINRKYHAIMRPIVERFRAQQSLPPEV